MIRTILPSKESAATNGAAAKSAASNGVASNGAATNGDNGRLIAAKESPTRTAQKRIFVVEAQPVYRTALEELINRAPELTVCGLAGNAAQALTAFASDQPDAAVIDLALPGKSGLDLIKDIHVLWPKLLVLVLSTHDETLYAERVLHAGGRGYIMKDAPPETIVKAICRVLDGEIYLSEKMSARALSVFTGRSTTAGSIIAALTDREFEILHLVGLGLEGQAIARKLNLSIKTVDTHRAKLKKKLHLSNGTELICYAARMSEANMSCVG